MTIGYARKTIVNYECKHYNAIIVNNIGCETGKETATSVYSEKRAYYNLDVEIETTLKLVKTDKDWKISKESKEITTITRENKPELVTDVFIKLLSKGNYETARMLTVSKTKNKLIKPRAIVKSIILK